MAIRSELIASIKDVEKFAKVEAEALMQKVEARLLADIYAICVPSKERTKTKKAVRTLRKEQWNVALRKAKGDEEKAVDLLLESY